MFRVIRIRIRAIRVKAELGVKIIVMSYGFWVIS